MAKKIVGFIKLQVPAGKANPSPPIGPALGQRGLNIMEFCKAFNAKTQGMEPGLPIHGGDHRLRGQELHLHHERPRPRRSSSRRPLACKRVRPSRIPTRSAR